MRFLLAILLISPTAFAAQKRVWDCQISASLKGSGQHFLYYGRDAWNGDGSLYCESGGLNVYRTVAVSFNSMSAGFGADRNSAMQIMINLDTQMNPSELKIQTLVADRNDGSKIDFFFQSELNRAEVYVTYLTPSDAKRSLQRGTLFIRSAGE